MVVNKDSLIASQQNQIQQLLFLQTVTQAMGEADGFQVALQTFLEHVQKLTNWVSGESWMLKENVLVPGGAWYSSTPQAGAFHQHSISLTFSLNEGLPGRVWSSKQVEHLTDLTTTSVDHFFRLEAAMQAGFVEAVGFPFLADNQVLAVLVFLLDHHHPQNNLFIELVSTAVAHSGHILQQKLIKAALHEREALFAGIIAIVQEAIISINTSGNIIIYNTGAEKIFGYTAQEAIGQPLNLLIPNRFHFIHNQHITQFDSAVGRRMGESREVYGVRKNGEEFPAEAYILRLAIAGEKVFTVVLRDITERKRAEEALRYAQEELEQRVVGRTMELAKANEELVRSNKELDQFAYIVSHDLRAPLRALNNYSLFLKEDYGGVLDESGKEYLRGIADSAKYMDRLVIDLLEYSRIRRVQVEFGLVKSSELLERIINRLQLREQATIRIPTDAPEIWARDVHLEQIFTNLLSNAVKFCKPNVPPVVTVSWKDAGNDWLFEVQDNGIGIAAQYSEKIFGIFQRLHTQDEYEGTGIGLAIVKKVVEENNGRIWVDSIPGQGSTFSFTLPKKAAKNRI